MTVRTRLEGKVKMPVFFVHDVRQGYVTPLDRRFRVHDVSASTELNEEKTVHQQPDSSQNAKQKSHQFQQNITDQYSGLGQVKSIMTSPVLSIRKERSLSDAWMIMQKHVIHHLAIIDENNAYCGMLSEKVILSFTMARPDLHPDDIPLSIFCQQTMLSTHPDTLISDLARAMLEYGLDSIAVTNNENGSEKLVGIVTYSDILKIILKSQVLGIEA